MSIDLSDFDLPIDANIPAHQVQALGPGVSRFAFGHDQQGMRHIFFVKDVLNEKQTAATGKEVWEPVEFIQYYKDKFQKPVHQVTDYHRALHADTYDRWKKGLEAPGTPLSKWERLDYGDLAGLTKVGIFSVDQLAATPYERLRVLCPRWGKGLKELHEKAQQHVRAKQSQEDFAERDERLTKLEEDNAKLREELTRLMTVNEAKAEKNGTHKASSSKRGAPKREILITDEGTISV